MWGGSADRRFVPERWRARKYGRKSSASKGRFVAGSCGQSLKPHPADPVGLLAVRFISFAGAARCSNSYSEQLKIKQNSWSGALQRIREFPGFTVESRAGACEVPWGTEIKGFFASTREKDKVSRCFYEEESHRLVPHFCRHLFSSRVISLLEYLEAVLAPASGQTLGNRRFGAASYPDPGKCGQRRDSALAWWPGHGKRWKVFGKQPGK